MRTIRSENARRIFGEHPRISRGLSAPARVCVAAAVVLAGFAGGPTASAATALDLGTAADFAVLGASTVTAVPTPPTTFVGNVGVSPGTAITGIAAGQLTGGTLEAGTAVAATAHADLATAYGVAAGLTSTAAAATLGHAIDVGHPNGEVLGPGVYSNGAALPLAGTLTLDAGGDPSAVFVFKAGSTLITGVGSEVRLTGGAQACNVFWQVGSSATLDLDTVFKGTILANTSVTVNAGTQVEGRVLAVGAAVTLDRNTITRPTCGPTGSLSISVPNGPVGLGSQPTGGANISGSLGAVTVTDTRLPAATGWTATVSTTDFTTGAATTHETVSKGLVTYTSGSASQTGTATLDPGGGVLSTGRNAYTATGVTGPNTADWNPTISVNVPAAAVKGTYTAVITHSVF